MLYSVKHFYTIKEHALYLKALSLNYRTLPRSYPHCIMISSQTINKQVGIAVIQRSTLVNRCPELSDESASVLSCLEEKNAASNNKKIIGDSMSVPIIIFGKISPGEESAILLPNAKKHYKEYCCYHTCQTEAVYPDKLSCAKFHRC
jgi:hypothetical protein